MGQPLLGPRLKVERAKHHIHWLEDEARRVKNDPHSVIEQLDSETEGYSYQVSDSHLSPEWGVVIGDVVHNLHTALDQIVWQLAQMNDSERETALKEGREWPPNSAQFPIFKTPKGFKNDGRAKISCLTDLHRRQIEDLQPYKRSGRPEQDPIWLLYALSTTDKHHVLNATVIHLTEIPEPFTVITTNPETGEPVHTYRNPGGRYERVQVVVKVGSGAEDGYIAAQAEGQFPVEVAFTDPGSRFGREIGGQPVVPLMHAAAREVEAIIELFERSPS